MKFKELIKTKAVLIVFYNDLPLAAKPITEIRNLAAYFGKEVDIFKINIAENKELGPMRLTSDLTYAIYSYENLVTRLEGYQKEDYLKSLLINLLTKNL